MKLKAIIYVFLASAFLSSCIKEHIATQLDKYDIARPLTIKKDTTLILVRDFFPLIKNISNISSKDFDVISNPYNDTIKLIKKDSLSILSTIEVSSEGETATIIAFDKRDQRNNLLLYSEYADDSEIRLTAEFVPEKVVVMWQNSVLSHEYSTIRQSADSSVNIYVKIPECSKDFETSFIRVFATDGKGLSNDILIPIKKGVVVNNSNMVTRGDKHSYILYSLLIDRFYDGNPSNTKKLNSPDVLPKVDYYGGDLEGVLEKIKSNYFSDLGINTIWLSPITQNPYDAWGQNKDPKTKFSGYHGYWPIFITKIDDRFGNEKVLKELLDEAHKRGINVILDYVANHMHINSPTLTAHPDWVTPKTTPDGRPNLQLWDEFRLTTWFDNHIPSLDLERQYVYEPMTDSALLWLKNFDFDGFRHDATKHIPEVYWRTLTTKILKSFPGRNVFQIGETYGSPELIESYVKNGMLDGQFDFNVYDAFIRSTVDSTGDFNDLKNNLMNSLNTYGYHNVMGYITGNHDRPRFISLAGGAVSQNEDTKMAGWKREIGVGDEVGYDKLAMLQAFIFTIPGVPCIYYGDEYGDPGANDPDNRRWMRFDGYSQKENALVNNAKKMINLRKTSLPLIYGDLIPLKTEKDIISYCRIYFGEIVIVTLNKTKDKKEIQLNLPFEIDPQSTIENFGKLLSADKKVMTLEVAPVSFTIISAKLKNK